MGLSCLVQIHLTTIYWGATPNLATKFLDMTYEKAVRDDFANRFLNDCYSTMTTRINAILTKESVRCFMGSDFTAKDIITSGDHPLSVFLCWPEKDLLALSPLIRAVAEQSLSGTARGTIARRFHESVAEMLADECIPVRGGRGSALLP